MLMGSEKNGDPVPGATPREELLNADTLDQCAFCGRIATSTCCPERESFLKRDDVGHHTPCMACRGEQSTFCPRCKGTGIDPS